MAVNEVDPIARLRAWVDQYPTQQAAATAMGITPSYLSEMLSGKRYVSTKTLALLGLREAVIEAPELRRPAVGE